MTKEYIFLKEINVNSVGTEMVNQILFVMVMLGGKHKLLHTGSHTMKDIEA